MHDDGIHGVLLPWCGCGHARDGGHPRGVHARVLMGLLPHEGPGEHVGGGLGGQPVLPVREALLDEGDDEEEAVVLQGRQLAQHV